MKLAARPTPAFLRNSLRLICSSYGSSSRGVISPTPSPVNGRFDRLGPENPLEPGEHIDVQGFFQALFDLSFRRFITLRLTGILYAIALALGGLYALGWGLAGFGESLGQGLLRLVVLAPLGFLLYAIWVRILLEASVSLIRVAQNTSDILEELRKKP